MIRHVLGVGFKTMKIRYLLIVAIWIWGYGLAAQTQMPNRDFEQWTRIGKGTALPKHWHSFGDGDCRLQGVYSWGCSQMLKHHSDRVRGHSGYGCEIFTTSIAGNIVNGVITTGQTLFSSPDGQSVENYNYTDKDNVSGNNAYMKFTGRPDSVYFWCKFDMKKSSTVAIAKFHLHGDVAYRDISVHTSSTPQKGKIGNAFCELHNPGDHKWHQYKFKFTYYDEQNRVVKSSSRTPSYLLASFCTNKVIKSGYKGDRLIVDDIEMIYNKRLAYMNVNGERMPDFDPDRTEYTFYCDNNSPIPVFTAEAQSPNARVSITQPSVENGFTARIVVTHDDGEQEYRVNVCRQLVADR